MQKLLFSALGLALIMGTTTSLKAQDKTSAEDLRKQLIEKYDKDKDGKLNEEEREAARAEFLKQNKPAETEEQPRRDRRPQAGADGAGRRGRGNNPEFEARRKQFESQFDKDGDGELSEAEREAMRDEFRKRGEQQRAAFMKEWDKDGDGELSESERNALREAGEKRRKEFTAKYDKDGNGDIDESEREAIREDMQKQREELTKKYDADKNGFLSLEEMDKARKDGALENNGFGGFGGFGGPGFGGPRGQRGDREGGRRRGDGEGRPRRPGGGDGDRRPQRPGQPTETN